MISGDSSCFPSASSQGLHMYQAVTEDVVSSTLEASSSSETHSNSLLYNLSLLKDKVHQVESLISILIAPDHSQPNDKSTSVALANMSTMIQEIIVAASSVMFTCQQMGTGNDISGNNINTNDLHQPRGRKAEESSLLSQPNFGGNHAGNIGQERGQSFFSPESFDWCSDNCNTSENIRGIHVSSNNRVDIRREILSQEGEGILQGQSPKNYDIIELDAADLLAKYTHYCQVCGKGFKRDANLRMHMRAHGDEYKTTAALSNPMKNNPSATPENKEASMTLPRKYSCPHEGCRWNRKHAKFQPLKSMICVKNHYKRSHCPKMYVCKRCNRKQFSVLSDLRTHEKHCGDLKWLCSCGTTFSRKDKLMGHVALFFGHTPAINGLTRPPKFENQAMQMHLDHDRG
ncbi:protein SENSITIVE TO PROTON RHIZOTOXICITY 2 [Populus alba]|uniref:C2H2-type domain-containing protein n=2 Tax=Populus alba TaxID=43335 RepID=A0A4U5NRT5_POPAL|nr:protein SENSITIVE TO PROTON RHIZOTOXICITY 2 [Populus alba]TKR85730.1 hypothetical protein D5086_0000243510 [Populus alba]